MVLLAQSNHLTEDPTMRVGALGIVILLCLGLWMLIRWLFSGPQRPDPWSDEVAAEIAKDDAVPLCHRCLAPHDSRVDFCPDCGAPVGAYTNWLPYPYLFSIGHTLRIGASGDFRRSPAGGHFDFEGVVHGFQVVWSMALRFLDLVGAQNRSLQK